MKRSRLILIIMAMLLLTAVATIAVKAGNADNETAVLVPYVSDNDQLLPPMAISQASVLDVQSTMDAGLLTIEADPVQSVTIPGMVTATVAIYTTKNVPVDESVFKSSSVTVSNEASSQSEKSAWQSDYTNFQTKEELVITPGELKENAFYMELQFRFDRYELDPNYMRNEETMAHFKHVLDSIGYDNITRIEIISQSSPEGTYDHNMWLSDKRAATMTEYMNETFPELNDRVEINPDGESWKALRSYVVADEKMTEKSKDKTIDVIDADDIKIATKKWRMENILGTDPNVGGVYRYLKRVYYPEIRFSRIYISHMTEPDTVRIYTPIIIEEPDTVEEIVPVDTVPVYQPVYRRFPKLSVKTNLLYDAFFTPTMGYSPIVNVEAEYYLKENGRWSVMAEYWFPWWVRDADHQYFQILNWQLEGRRYFKKANNFTGHYLSAYAQGGYYDLCFDYDRGEGYQGEGGSLGLGYGYVMPLNKRGNWKLEFFLKGGFFMSYYDPYDIGNEGFNGKYYYMWDGAQEDFRRRNWRFRWFGPTGAGVTLSYDLIYRKKLVE